jgi:hypothetical protein
VIDKAWIEKWKLYINYDVLKRINKFPNYYRKKTINIEDSQEDIDKRYPGVIDNSRLVYELKSFHNDGNIDSRDNIIVRVDIDKKEDLKLVNREIWEYLNSLYKGGPAIVCDIIESPDNRDKKIIEIYMNRFMCIFLPKEFEEPAIDEIAVKPLFYSVTLNMDELKTKMAAIGYGVKDPNKIRLWKLNDKISFDELIDYLKSLIKTTDNETDKLTYLECKFTF